MPADVRRLTSGERASAAGVRVCLGAVFFASRADAFYEENGVVYGAKIIGYSTDLRAPRPVSRRRRRAGTPTSTSSSRSGPSWRRKTPREPRTGTASRRRSSKPRKGSSATHTRPRSARKPNSSIGKCSPDTQVGYAEPGIELTEGCRHKGDDCNAFVPCCGFPLYNLIPPPEQAGLLGFQPVFFGYPVLTVLSARTGGDFGLDARVVGITQTFPLRRYDQVLWGVPASPAQRRETLLARREPSWTPRASTRTPPKPPSSATRRPARDRFKAPSRPSPSTAS